jgi:hypothetical protein
MLGWLTSRMKFRSFILGVLVLLTAARVFSATYYIDFVGGADTNNGTAKATPWKHHPYMTGATGVSAGFTHAAGDRYIFKGGITWDSTCWQMNISSGGSGTGNRDYYGVDQTWFTGGSWTRPIFDSGYVSLNQHRVVISAAYVQIDNIEMKRLKCSDLSTAPSLLSWFSVAGILGTNLYIHGWLTTSVSDNAYGGVCIGTSSPPTDAVLDNCEIENSENIGGQRSGVCARDVAIFQNGCRVHDNSSCILGCIDFNGSYCYNVSGDSFDGVYHCNGVYCDPSFFLVSQGYIRNSWFHDSYLGANLAYPNIRSGATITMYNNVIYGNQSTQGPVNIDTFQYNGEGAGNLIAYNNTIANQQGLNPAFGITFRTIPVTQIGGFGGFYVGAQYIINTVGTTNFVAMGASSNTVGVYFTATATGTGTGVVQFPVNALTLWNNHVINASAIDGSTSTNTHTYSTGTSLLQSSATATGQGYVLGNLYAPVSNSVGTYNTGTSESGTFTTDILGISRPQFTTWDIGAYEFNGSTGTGGPLLSGGLILSGGAKIF